MTVNTIGDDGVKEIAMMLKTNTSIRDFGLAGEETIETWKNFAKAIKGRV